MNDATSAAGPVPPAGFNHIVLNVHDIEESQAFWAGILGFRHVGTLRPGPGRPPGLKMRFYSLERAEGLSHHDLALVENTALPPKPENWSMFGPPSAVNHIALCWPSREAWLKQLEFMQAKGVVFHRRIEHGMTHSVYVTDPNGYAVEVLYELPRAVWEGDIDAALNYAVARPTEGREALEDRHEDVPVFGQR